MTTSNLGHTLLGGGGGIMPASLAQEIASGNFHDNRESFHDYIYSKLILGEDNNEGDVNNMHSNNAHNIPANNVPVFPSPLIPNYASSIAPQPPMSAVDFTINPNNSQNNNHNMGIVGVNESTSVSSNNNQSSEPTHINIANATIPSTPQVSTLKPSGSSKKKSQHKNNLQQQHMTNLTQINVPNHEGLMNVTKPKKNKSPKQKKEKVNFCDVCGRGFAERYTLNRHMMTHTHVKPYSCTKCNMSFSRSDGLAKHMKAGHRRIDAHHCDVCGGTFNSELSFEQHKREYGTTLPFVCNLCMLAFSQCCHLNYHMKSHSLKSDYGVEVTAETAEAVDVDALVPEDFAPQKSKDSPNKINFAVLNASLNPNIRIKHEVDENFPFNNSKTGDLLQNQAPGNETNMSAISNAIAVATGVSSDNPSDLAATSNKTSLSEIDMKKYYDIKVPNPRFMDSSSADSSITGTTTTNNDGTTSQQPLTLFRCHICGKGFTRKYHMQRHVRLHTRGPIPRAHLLDWTRRPYACGVCKMGFTRQHHLTRHMLIHTGERPHSCHICGKAFRRYTNLSLHVRTVHGSERPFKCPICGRGFPRVYSLQRHLNTHGKNNDEQLLMNAGLLPFPKKEGGGNENDNSASNQQKPEQQQYLTIGTPKLLNVGQTSNNSIMQHRDALLSDGSDVESSAPNHHQQHQQGIDPARQSEIDRINASIEDTIGEVIKGAMAQGNKKPKTKKSASSSHRHQNQSSNTTPSQAGLNSNIANNTNTTSTMQGNQMINLSLQQQQQQHNDILHQHHQQQQQQQQQQHHQLHHHQQQQPQPQHSRHLTITQDSNQDHFANSSQSSILSNALSRQHDLVVTQQRSGNFTDLNTLRSSTPSTYSQQQQQQHQDRSTTPFNLNQQQQQQQQQNDSRPSSAYAIIHSSNEKSTTPYTITQTALSSSNRDKQGVSSVVYSLNSTTNQSIATGPDRSSTPYSHQAQAILNQQTSNNLDAFQGGNNTNAAIVATTSASSRSHNQQLQQIVTQLDRSEARDPIIYAHSANGFQIPMGTTMDLSTTQRNRLVVGNPTTNPTIRQAPTDFSHNLTLGPAALNLNAEAAAFAHVQATNNLSSLFPGNATLTYHQQQLMGEALSRLDLELQAAHQQGSGQLPATSHNNTGGRPY